MSSKRNKGKLPAFLDPGEDTYSPPQRKTPSPPAGRQGAIIRARHHVKQVEEVSLEEKEREQARLQELQLQQQLQHKQMLQKYEEERERDQKQRIAQRQLQKQRQQQQQQQQMRRQAQQQPQQGPTLIKEKIATGSANALPSPAPPVLPLLQDTPTLVARLAGPTAQSARPANTPKRVEATLRIKGIPSKWTLLDLFDTFEKYGSVNHIEVFENSYGERDGNGRIRFVPPPLKEFWQKWPFEVLDKGGRVVRLGLTYEEPRPLRTVASPVDPRKILPECYTFSASALDFGLMHSPNVMLSMYRTHCSQVQFEVNLEKRRIDVQFKHSFKAPPPEDVAYRSLISEYQRIMKESKVQQQKPRDKRKAQTEDSESEDEDEPIEAWEREESYRFQIRFEHLESILEQPMDDKNTRAFVISLNEGFPPEFYRRLHRTSKSFSADPKERVWTEWDAWFRQTTITYQPECMHLLPTSLYQPYSTIDIGRWTTYRFSFKFAESQRGLLNDMLSAIKDWNIDTRLVKELTLLETAPLPVWNIIDPPRAAKNLIEEFQEKQYLTFPLRYQLEAVISSGYLSEYNLDREFIQQLKSIPEPRALAILEHVYERKERIYEPSSIFSMARGKKNIAGTNLESYCVILRRALVTPTTIRFASPSIEYSNRVLRRWAEHADKFLRVQFQDETRGDKLRYQKNASKDDVFTRVHNTLFNGITIGDRHYEFLAFGSSQFREHGAYMFASDEYIQASQIRKWMGKFDKIRVVGKYCARLGQCFSATRAITGVRVNITETPDIIRNGKQFTDGVGKMSKFVARMIADDLKLPGKDPPSAFQFRLGGYKGVLAISPDVQNFDIVIRKSQEKFTADHKGLEVIRPASFASASLNRQLILVLTARGVPGYVFEDMLRKQLEEMKIAMTDSRMALDKLTKTIDENQMSLFIASMITDGFMTTQEPFLMTLLQLWRAYHTKNLKEKTKITVEKGAFLLGVVDETGLMRGHFDTDEDQKTDEEKLANLPEIFCQVSDYKTPGKYIIREGVCIIARNPSLHPGDVRVVRAVNIPRLHHLRDVLVLPQTGDADLAGMCSGGDLDGDDYFISWDENLIPEVIDYPPMDYTAPAPAELDRPVTVKDMIEFFCTYMKNDRLGHIANTHVAWADALDSGVLHPRCIDLAELHSTAVDYPKSGYPAIMPRSLRPQRYPHFMEKRNGERVYHSKKILGRLYDQVEKVAFAPVYSTNFDDRILKNPLYVVSERLLRSAKAVKNEYDVSVRRVLGQYDIQTEFEIFSTFVMKYKGCKNDYNFHEELGRIQKTLCDRIQKMVYEKVGGKHKSALASFVVAMYKVTHQDVVIALRDPEAEENMRDPSRMPLISFPWIFRELLGKLARGNSPYNTKIEYDPPTFGPGGKEKEKIEDLPELDYYDEFPGLGRGATDENSSGHETSQDEGES